MLGIWVNKKNELKTKEDIDEINQLFDESL
jgi:hypothetical protein